MQRTTRIMEILTTYKTVTNDQLCKSLFCSISSLRRDLIKLEKDGCIKRTRGGATLLLSTGSDFSSHVRENTMVAEKEYIASIAKDFLASGMSLFLDASSTTMRLCPILNKLHNITVVTNGIATATQLNNCDQINTYITGGHLRKGNASLLGETASEYIGGFKADIAFLSCRGVCADGTFEADIEHCLIKQHMIRNANKTILLADSSKFGQSFFHRLCNFKNLEAIITDRAPASEIEQAITESGSEIIY